MSAASSGGIQEPQYQKSTPLPVLRSIKPWPPPRRSVCYPPTVLRWVLVSLPPRACSRSRCFRACSRKQPRTRPKTQPSPASTLLPPRPDSPVRAAGCRCDIYADWRTGTGYVEGFDEGADQIIFTVTSSTQKLYDLSIAYLGPFGDKVTRISLNGGAGGDVSLPAVDVWTTVGAGQVLLNAGVNTIAVQSNWGWYFIDALLVAPSAPRAPHQVTDVLVNKDASPAAKALMTLLVSNYGKKYISGQQDPVSLAWVETNIGKTPAIIGLDFIEYSPSRVEHGSTSTAVEDAIAFDKRGGIVTFCWRE